MAAISLRAGWNDVSGGRRAWPRLAFTADSDHRPSSRPRSPREGEGKVFKSGESVRETGIYEVLHDGAHRAAHEVVMLASDAFPSCETCAARVRFRLVRTAPYIFQDEDFGKPGK